MTYIVFFIKLFSLFVPSKCTNKSSLIPPHKRDVFNSSLSKPKRPLQLNNRFDGVPKRRLQLINYWHNRFDPGLSGDRNSGALLKWKVVISSAWGFRHMLNNWLYYYEKLNLGLPTRLIAEDDETFKFYSERNLPYLEVVKGVEQNMTNEAHSYESTNYKKIVSQRARYLLEVLNKNENVLYSDIDSIWLHDPRPYFIGEDISLWAQSDGIRDRTCYVCTGLLAIRCNNEMKNVVKEWGKALEQNNALNQPIFHTTRLSLMPRNRVKCLTLDKFPHGDIYFAGERKNYNSPQRKNTIIIHNNYIRGYETKIWRFMKWGHWANKEEIVKRYETAILDNEEEIIRILSRLVLRLGYNNIMKSDNYKKLMLQAKFLVLQEKIREFA